jgi:hypothetical protein
VTVASALPIASTRGHVRTSPEPPERPLHFSEGFLDGVEVRRVGWQVEQLAAYLFDQIHDDTGLASVQWTA